MSRGHPRLTVRLEPELLASIAAKARTEGAPVSSVLRTSVAHLHSGCGRRRRYDPADALLPRAAGKAPSGLSGAAAGRGAGTVHAVSSRRGVGYDGPRGVAYHD